MRSFIRNLRHEDHKKALMATLVFIFLMMLFFLLVSLEYPDPPPQEKIVEVEIDFGSEYEGGGQIAEVSEVIPDPQPESANEKAVQEESPVVVTSAKGKSSTSKNKTTTKPTTEPKPDRKPKVDDAFAFPGSGTAGEGTGKGTGFGKGTGVGNGGEGNDPGEGKTNTSRKLKSKGSIPGSSQEEGLIALDLYVDATGRVVKTKRNESKSTSGSAYLTDLAKKNAATYKYEAIPGAPVQFVGTVIFNFRKQ